MQAYILRALPGFYKIAILNLKYSRVVSRQIFMSVNSTNRTEDLKCCSLTRKIRGILSSGIMLSFVLVIMWSTELPFNWLFEKTCEGLDLDDGILHNTCSVCQEGHHWRENLPGQTVQFTSSLSFKTRKWLLRRIILVKIPLRALWVMVR
jgi:hypothetical protein